MITRYRNRAITRMGIGLLMLGLVALMPVLKRSGVPEFIVVLGGTLLVIGGLIVYFRGCVTLAEAKGHSGGVVVGAIVFSALLFPLSIVLVPIVLTFALEDRNSPSRGAGGHRKHRRHHYESRLEWIIHCRRNALLGIYFGLAGIALGVFLVIFRTGLFSDHSKETVLGIFVFLGGYSAVITGCWWWLKAKGLNEALVSIGLMPLILLFIPFVRLIVLAAPAILPVGMAIMPFILIVVVLALPDQSGASGRKRWSKGGSAAHLRSHESAEGGMGASESNLPAEPTARAESEGNSPDVDVGGRGGSA